MLPHRIRRCAVNPYENEAAWWATGLVGAVVLIWKSIWNMRKDARDDKEGKSRKDLIERLQEEIKRQNDLINALSAANERMSDQVDEEINRRRVAEERIFFANQKINLLERHVRDLGGTVGD